MSATLGRNKPALESPTAPFFPGHTHDMIRTSSDDSYLHVLAARKTNQDPETGSIASFTCALGSDFDRQREKYDANRLASQLPEQRQTWLDNAFGKLSDKYRTKRDAKTGNKSMATKGLPHFLDLSSIIAPLPLGTRSEYEDLKTPQAEEDRQLTLDANTPKPMQRQHFKGNYLGSEMRLPSPPLISPLNPTFALEPLGPSTQQNVAPIARLRAIDGSAPRALRKQKSFDNPSEIRRRQKQEWVHQNENLPGGLSIAIPPVPEWARAQQQIQVAQRGSDAVPASPGSLNPSLPSPLSAHPQLSHLARPVQMSRGISQDTASRQQQQFSPVRPKLGSRTSSSALRNMSKFDPSSSTGFSFARPPPLLPSSRESYDSSTGSESQPQTPVSATYMRALPYINTLSPPRNYPDVTEQKEYVREWDDAMAMDLQSPQHRPHQQQQLGSALGLMPGKMVRAYSDSPSQVSRLRSGSESSTNSVDLAMTTVSNPHRTPRPARNQQRPSLRREQTTEPNPSPSKRHLDLQSMPYNSIATTPRSSSLKDIQAELNASPIRTIAESRPSLDSLESDDAESSLAYTKPSPNLPQRSNSSRSNISSVTASPSRSTSRNAFPFQLERDESHATALSITPTNSYRAALADNNVSKWSPNAPPSLHSSISAQRRDQTRADEWGANLRKLTRGTAA